ncbi:MAG: sigma-54-dependent Fis family transcriptional regulator [Gammaproteobacteria bacterium]|nr:sigma-54-dependent Fis family transcriptional regulator [Gammaproteobacteria bacterium]MCP5135722.1 sigma-54-dependent Fis family transcriptional regulator [Gammaproteobacteria bacterium]
MTLSSSTDVASGISGSGCTEQSRAVENRCRGLLHQIGLSVHEARILVVGSADHAALSEIAARAVADIDLLVALDAGVLDCAGLLARCRQVLVAPFEEALLARCIDAIASESGGDPLLVDLLERNIIGRSEAIRSLRRQIPTVAAYTAPVAISGETGTGKELVARAVHYCSPRQDRSFVPVNCAALSDDLLLAELFGHERGAFTDARQARRGLVAQADGGTLFLDEVDSLSARAQGALLRFLQDREYRPVGSERLFHADVRVVCATNRDLHAWVDQGHFREDLYYRLNVVDLTVPPLRERHGDVELLAEHFLGHLGRQYEEPQKCLHPLTLRWMDTYDWPGNVRELENQLHRSHVMCSGPSICVPAVMGEPVQIGGGASPSAALGDFQDEKARVVARFERDYLRRILETTNGNVSAAARRAGKERRAFTRLLDKHGIAPDRFRDDADNAA